MSDIQVIVALLWQVLREPLRRKELVSRVQELVWKGLDPSTPTAVQAVLRDLAYDLDFFEPTSRIRAEDTSYYGHRRLEEEVRSALAALRDAGIDVGPAC